MRLLTDRLPFGGAGDGMGRFELPFVPPSRLNAQVDVRLDQVLLKALAFDPTARFPNASAFLESLARIKDQPTPSSARTDSVLCEKSSDSNMRQRKNRFGSDHGKIRMVVAICIFFVQLVSVTAHGKSRKITAKDDEGPDSEAEISAKAKTLFEGALGHYQEGKYDLALKEFLAAQAMMPRKSIQINIARTYKALGDVESVRKAYTDLVLHYGNSVISGHQLTEKERDEAEQEIANACGKLLDSGKHREALDALLSAKKTVLGKAARTIQLYMGRVHLALKDDISTYREYSKFLAEYGPKSTTQEGLPESERTEVYAALVRARQRTGMLRGKVSPPGVKIRILSGKLGSTDQDSISAAHFEEGVRERIGRYTLEFSKMGYVTETRDIEIIPDDSRSISVMLKPVPSVSTSELDVHSPQLTPPDLVPPRETYSSRRLPANIDPSRYESGAVESDPIVRNHDGFYMRLSIGGGYTFDSLGGMDATGTDMSGITMRGACFAFDFAFGGTVGPVVIGGLMSGAFLSSPKYSNESKYDRSKYEHGYVFAGPFVDYFLDSHLGTHIGAAIGMGSSTVTPPSDQTGADQGNPDSSPGFGALLMAGHDFWVSDQWSLGFTARVMYVHSKDEFGAAHSAVVPVVLFSGLYH